jgi:hypothetical protein
VGGWGWGSGPNPQSPIPNPQSPIQMGKKSLRNYIILLKLFSVNNKLICKIFDYYLGSLSRTLSFQAFYFKNLSKKYNKKLIHLL